MASRAMPRLSSRSFSRAVADSCQGQALPSVLEVDMAVTPLHLTVEAVEALDLLEDALLKDIPLNALALPVQLTQLRGQLLRPAGVPGQKQLNRHLRHSHPPGGVDSGGQGIAHRDGGASRRRRRGGPPPARLPLSL